MASMDYEQSLDDIIKADKSSSRGGRGGGRGRGGRSSRGRGGRGGDSVGRSARPTSSGGGAGAKALKAALSAATSTTRGGRGGGGGRASRGRARGGRGRGVTAGKTQPTVVPAGRWKHDMFSGPRAKRGQMASANVVQRRRLAPAGPKIMNLKPKKRVAKAAPLTTGTVLRVTNLDDGVTASDMKELFESEGTLKKVVMTSTHCDITFQVKEDAVQAMQKFNGVTLDGEQMKIKLMSSLGSTGRDVKFTVTL